MAIYFFVMFILDVRFILNNEENFESSMPASGENIIYTVCMAIPLLILLIIKLMGQSFFLWGDDPVHTHYILKVA